MTQTVRDYAATRLEPLRVCSAIYEQQVAAAHDTETRDDRAKRGDLSLCLADCQDGVRFLKAKYAGVYRRKRQQLHVFPSQTRAPGDDAPARHRT